MLQLFTFWPFDDSDPNPASIPRYYQDKTHQFSQFISMIILAISSGNPPICPSVIHRRQCLASLMRRRRIQNHVCVSSQRFDFRQELRGCGKCWLWAGFEDGQRGVEGKREIFRDDL
jgi:hypothetical protein